MVDLRICQLHIFFNKNNVEISYWAMTDIEEIIMGNNHELLMDESTNKIETCNCRKSENGHCIPSRT